MFDDQQLQPGAPSSSKKAPPPEDIFSGVDEEASSVPPPTPVSVPAPTNPVVKAPLPPGLGDEEIFSTPPRPVAPLDHARGLRPAQEEVRVVSRSHGGAAKRMIVIGVIAVLIVVAAVLLASLILRSRKAVSPLSEPSPSVPSVTTPLEDIIAQPSSVLPGSDNPRIEDDLLLGTREPATPVDSDRDGLSDEEELSLGTSPRSADTDADGLSDRDEAKQWGTNPLNPDTDGDGYKDGDEVNNGYDPKGSGKLFEIPGE